MVVLLVFVTFRPPARPAAAAPVFHNRQWPDPARSSVIHGFIHIIHQNQSRKQGNNDFADAENSLWAKMTKIAFLQKNTRMGLTFEE